MTVQEYNLAPYEVIRFKGPEINDEIVVRIEAIPTVPGVIYTRDIHDIAGESGFAGVTMIFSNFTIGLKEVKID